MYTILKVTEIKIVLLTSYMSKTKRRKIIQIFIQSLNEIIMLVIVYNLEFTNFNLQFLC